MITYNTEKQYINFPSNDVSIIYQISPSAKLITKCNLQNSSAVYLGSESKVSKHRAKNTTKTYFSFFWYSTMSNLSIILLNDYTCHREGALF